MNFFSVPKLMQWQSSLDQHFITNKSTLITSGCSFTSSTTQLKTAASWPGYAMDRCRFTKTLDYSRQGVGNEYIHDSIIHHFDSLSIEQAQECMVIVMWSGLDRKEQKISKHVEECENYACLNNTFYVREKIDTLDRTDKQILAQESADFIFSLYTYLKSKNISFVFSFYANVLFAPYIPKRDTTFEFDEFVSKSTLAQLQNLPFIPNKPMDFLYEYAFVNDYLETGDKFHPPSECNLAWTDNILLPGMVKQGLIYPR